MLSLITLILTSAVSASISGNQMITTHDYNAVRSALDTNPVFCGYPGSQLDIDRITAVEGLTQGQCGTCLQICNGNDDSKCTYVLAVDRGGRGLDLSTKAFQYLFNDYTGVYPAKWNSVSSSFCSGILRNGDSPNPAPPVKVYQEPAPAYPTTQPAYATTTTTTTTNPPVYITTTTQPAYATTTTTTTTQPAYATTTTTTKPADITTTTTQPAYPTTTTTTQPAYATTTTTAKPANVTTTTTQSAYPTTQPIYTTITSSSTTTAQSSYPTQPPKKCHHRVKTQ